MKRWTKDEEGLLRELVEQKWFYKDIAEKLERTRNSIEKKCVRLKISNNKKIKFKEHSQYVRDLKNRCPSIEVIEQYKGYDVSILHKCLICKEIHFAIPGIKIKGYGHCGVTNNSGTIPPGKPGITYLVYISKYNLYKVGITSKSIKDRMRSLRISSYEVILERYFDTGDLAIKLEKEWLANIKHLKVNTGKLRCGNTETFRFR